MFTYFIPIIIGLIIIVCGYFIYSKILIKKVNKSIEEYARVKKEEEKEKIKKELFIETAEIRQKLQTDIDSVRAQLEADQAEVEKRQEELQQLSGLVQSMGNTYSEMLDKHQKDKAELERQIQLRRAEAQEEYISQLAEYRKTAEEQKDEMFHHLAEIKEERRQAIDIEITSYREAETQKARTLAESEVESGRRWADASLAPYWDDLARRTSEKEKELTSTQEELDLCKKTIDAYKEDIRRRRIAEEQTDFYRICLTPEAKEDITILHDIRSRLHHPENLNKLIYENYISKQTQEMIKRVLCGKNPTGIYKITRLKTGEIYIGKAVGLKDRWTQHVKTAYGIGTIAHSTLHTTMEKDGVDQFQFEMLEECEKDELTAREKYYTEWYDSKNYGLNERVG